MKKQKYTLEKEIPILDWRTKEIVRNLRAEELDGRLVQEIEHDNVAEVFFDDERNIVYTTTEGGGAFIVTPGQPAKLGFLGRFDIDPGLLSKVDNNWQHYAALIAANVGTRYVEELSIYYCVVGNTLWEIAEPEKADNYLTLYQGEEEKTFYFRRIWPKEREERGLSAGNTL